MKKIVACDADSGQDAYCTTLYGTPDLDVAYNKVEGEFVSTDSSSDFKIYIAWAAPESASTECTVCYDSVDASVRIDVEGNSDGDVGSNGKTYHTWNAYWAPRYQADNTLIDDVGCCA